MSEENVEKVENVEANEPNVASAEDIAAVSYTHLTLPTNREV